MKISRETAILRLTEDRVSYLLSDTKMLYAIAQDGITGFNDLTNKELEEQYESAFNENVSTFSEDNKKMYHVTVNWATQKGNEVATNRTVEAKDGKEAMEIVTSKIRTYKRYNKIWHADAVETKREEETA